MFKGFGVWMVVAVVLNLALFLGAVWGVLYLLRLFDVI